MVALRAIGALATDRMGGKHNTKKGEYLIMPRKTIDVETLRTWVNTALSIPDNSHRLVDLDDTPDQAFRRGVASLLERVLHETGNYHGYNYLDTEFGESKIHLRDGYDDTRRRYLP